MKTIKYSIIFIACLMLNGCENFLDRPSLSDLSQEGFFGASRDIAAWQAGIYYQFQNTMNSGHLFWGDLRSDLYNGIREYVITGIYLNGLVSTQSQYSWQSLYRTVMLCNTAIEYYPKVPGVSESDYNDYLGQAYAMRALMYFYAIRVWNDVPIVDKLWDGIVSSSYVPRSPVSEVKTLIQSDIDAALKLLNNNVAGDRKYAFNRAATYALKADVHIWFKEYEEALEATEWFFIGTNPTTFKLIDNITDYRTIFTEPLSSTETIFTLYWNTGETGVGCDWCGQVGTRGGTGVSVNNGFILARSLFNTFLERIRSGNGTDARFVANYDTIGMYNLRGTPGDRPALSEDNYGGSFINKNIKYSPQPTGIIPQTGGWYTVLPLAVTDGSPDGRCQILWPVYRLADVYTIRAEALNKLGNGLEALQLVNDIRRRVGYTLDARTEVNHNDKDAIEWLILEERKLEFIAEGRRWFDLIRTDRIIDVMDPVYKERQSAFGQTEKGFEHPGRMWAPINSREFEANPALEQNEAYTGGAD